MTNNLLFTFIILNAMNVIIQTVKTLCTVKCGKTVAAAVNALAYGLYTVVVVYMVCELPLLLKCVIVALCNFIGVYLVKWFEEKARKDKLWKIEATVNKTHQEDMSNKLSQFGLSYNYIIAGKYACFNIYCKTQKETRLAHDVVDFFNAKYCITESKSF